MDKRKRVADILEAVSIGGDIGLATSHILALFPEPSVESGKELYMDLCGRLIRRILEFNPDEHDIELNLCGIIEKAKILGNNTCMCMDCGKVFKVSEQSKHFKECKKDRHNFLKPQTFTEDDFLKGR
jgi:hypothetical protein